MWRYSSILWALSTLAACGDSPEDAAFARCQAEVRKWLEDSTTGVAFPRQPEPALRDDEVYGWHMDVEVDTRDGAGRARRAGYRCLFLVEDRPTPLFLAVLER